MWLCVFGVAARSVTHELVNSSRSFHTDWAGDEMTSSSIYSAGDCSVCASAGRAIFVKALEDGKVFLACPECGCAWLKPPQPFVVDTIDAPIVFAPNGFCLATWNDVAAAGMADLIKLELTVLSAFQGMRGFRTG